MSAPPQQRFHGLSSHTSLSEESVSSFLSGRWMFLPKTDSVFGMSVPPPSQSHRRTMRERLTVALLPDATLQIQILDSLRMAPSQRWTPACSVLSQGWPAS